MPTANINRRELLDLVWGPRSDGLRDASGVEPSIRAAQEMTVTWREEDVFPGGTLPRVIAMPPEAHQEFLAWAYTYLAILRPLTAYVRLLDPGMASELMERSGTPALGQLREAFVALIIGECATRLGPGPDFPHQLTSNACANSHSFALARAIALGFEQQVDNVSATWSSARDLTRQPELDLGDLETSLQVLSGLRDRRPKSRPSMSPELPLLERACWEIVSAGDIKEETWSALTSPWASLHKIRGQMIESRENRIRAFDRAWTSIAEISRANPTLASFVSGYLGSRIAPGELDHVSVIARTLEAAPGALLWFGLCSGLRSDGQILGFAGGLGCRILRDLEQASHVLDRPRCDVAISELEVLLNRDKPLTDFRAGSNGLLTVELAPGVITTVRWPRPMDAQAELFERRDTSIETQDLIKDLSLALDRVDSIRRRLERTVDLGTRALRERTDPKSKRRY
jgi:hypothetical protein